MANVEELARAAVDGNALLLRSIVQDLMSNPLELNHLAAPETDDRTLLAVAASLVELLASRAGVAAPLWAANVPALTDVLFLLKSAHIMPRLRAMCERESPAPLKKRNLFAPGNFLEFA